MAEAGGGISKSDRQSAAAIILFIPVSFPSTPVAFPFRTGDEYIIFSRFFRILDGEVS